MVKQVANQEEAEQYEVERGMTIDQEALEKALMEELQQNNDLAMEEEQNVNEEQDENEMTVAQLEQALEE